MKFLDDETSAQLPWLNGSLTCDPSTKMHPRGMDEITLAFWVFGMNPPVKVYLMPWA